MCRNEKTTWWSPFSPSTRWVLGIKLTFAKLACQACLPDQLSHHSTDYEFFFKTWWIARSLSKLVRSLILPTLLELILAGLEPILAVPQLSVHSEVEAPCWQGLCCHLPPSVSLSLGYLLPNPLEALHFFLEMNDSANSSQSHGLPKHFSMFRVLCLRISYKHFPDLIEASGKSCCVFFLAKIEGRYQEVLAYHIYLVSFENTESWDSWLNIVFSKLWDNLWTLQDYYIKCTFRLSVKKKHKKPVFSH